MKSLYRPGSMTGNLRTDDEDLASVSSLLSPWVLNFSGRSEGARERESAGTTAVLVRACTLHMVHNTHCISTPLHQGVRWMENKVLSQYNVGLEDTDSSPCSENVEAGGMSTLSVTRVRIPQNWWRH